jgi:hypothetical protein
MKQEDIQKLIDRYLEGTTTPDEERQLARELLHLGKDAPEEWQAIRLMLGELAMGEAEYDALMESRREAAAESLCQEGNKRAAIVSMRRWIAAAACLLLVVGIGIKVLNTEEHQQQPLTAQTVEKAKTETEKSEAQQSEAQKPEVQESATAKPQTASPQQEVQEGKAQPQKAKKAVPASPKSSQPKDTLPKESPTQKTKPVPLMQTKKDPNLHYAAHEISKDTLPYQDPARVDSFVARLADYHEVKEGELKCSATQDSNVVSAVYVFPDKKEVDVFGRMLQVACWYHDATPGYLLTFSHQQFFFELKDMHRQLHYRWIAERINGKILLYCTHAPLGTKVSSTCYQGYRDELMHIKSINTKTREI